MSDHSLCSLDKPILAQLLCHVVIEVRLHGQGRPVHINPLLLVVASVALANVWAVLSQRQRGEWSHVPMAQLVCSQHDTGALTRPCC